jgi:antitoxin PrlF
LIQALGLCRQRGFARSKRQAFAGKGVSLGSSARPLPAKGFRLDQAPGLCRQSLTEGQERLAVLVTSSATRTAPVARSASPREVGEVGVVGLLRLAASSVARAISPPGGESGTHSPRPQRNVRAAAVPDPTPARRIPPRHATEPEGIAAMPPTSVAPAPPARPADPIAASRSAGFRASDRTPRAVAPLIATCGATEPGGIAAMPPTSVALLGLQYRGTVSGMRLAQSRITAQGQVSIPAEVRKRLGLAPGSTIEWEVAGDDVIVRRSRRFSSEDIRAVLFPDGPPAPRSLEELKQGIRDHARRRARR